MLKSGGKRREEETNGRSGREQSGKDGKFIAEDEDEGRRMTNGMDERIERRGGKRDDLEATEASLYTETLVHSMRFGKLLNGSSRLKFSVEAIINNL